MSRKFDYAVAVQDSTGKSYFIKPFLAINAIRGNSQISGSVLFPHNIGLSCTHKSEHFKNEGSLIQSELKEIGFNYALTPSVSVSHNPQWGGYFETMGE